MSPKLNPPRGTQDIHGKNLECFNFIYQQAEQTAQNFGYQSVETPIFEALEVFQKPLGESTDVVGKEMYEFEDRKGKKFVLRPEGTAAVLRAASSISELTFPARFFYKGPMFRYERPQAGRSRQFHQVGVELLGADYLFSDLETLTLGYLFLKNLGLEKTSILKINHLGEPEEIQTYKSLLVKFLKTQSTHLSEDSLRRLETNPLRILDSKSATDKEILKQAPLITESLKESSLKNLEEIEKYLKILKIPYEKDPFLVRGFDYYTHLVFEFQAQNLKAQNAILAGGRYQNLMKNFGLPDHSGIGWAAGVERLNILLQSAKSLPSFYHLKLGLVAVGQAASLEAHLWAYKIRAQRFSLLMGHSGNLSKQVKKLERSGVTHILFLGDEELATQKISLKTMSTGKTQSLSFDELTVFLKKTSVS